MVGSPSSTYRRTRLTLFEGRSLAIMKSGIIDLEEDYDNGYGGPKSCEILESEGIAALFPGLLKKQ